MDASLLGLYLKMNLLLAAAFLLWVLTKTLMHLFHSDVSHALQLRIARYFFVGLLLMTPMLLCLNFWAPALFAGFASSLQSQWLSEGLTVVAGLDNSLEQQIAFGGTSFNLPTLLLTFFLAGLALRLVGLMVQIVRLRRIIRGAVECKCIRRIHILFSPVVGTPFSTRALGSNHVVLPYQLLDSPRNLRLAVKHELQHLRNGDLEWVILLEAVKVLCFWNPAVYLWHNEFDCLQEFACDEVLINDRLVSSKAYGACLLEVASANSGFALIAASNMVPKFSLLSTYRSQLKRRILMLATARNTKHSKLKVSVYGLLVSAGLLNITFSTFSVFAADDVLQEAIDTANARNSYIPSFRENPQYPARALDEKLVGWVQVQFTIDETGSVRDLFVVKNCARPVTADAASCTADNIFDAATLAALAQWKYEPVINNGKAVTVEGVQSILRYELGEKSDEKAESEESAEPAQ